MKPAELNDHLELNYVNGAAATKPPVFSDVRLSRDSQAECELLVEEAKKEDRVIRNDSQMQKCIEVHGDVDAMIEKLKKLEAVHREPWVRVLSQISAALNPMKTQLQLLSSALRTRVNAWRQQKLEGERAEQERLIALAKEKEQEAKYAEDPRKKRAAAVAAKQLQKAAKEVAPKPEKGLGTEIYYEVEITNRVQAAKLPAEAVEMTPHEVWFNREIKRRLHAGEPFHKITFDGITVIKKSRTKFYK
jgi:hypothetical protein